MLAAIERPTMDCASDLLTSLHGFAALGGPGFSSISWVVGRAFWTFPAGPTESAGACERPTACALCLEPPVSFCDAR